MDYRQESIATAERPRDYAGLLWIFAASILGFSLFCGASAIALSDPTLQEPIAINPGEVVNFAFSNENSGAVLTLEAFSAFLPTSTITPTPSASPTETPSPTLSPTASNTPFFFRTATSKPNNPPPATSTNRPIPTNTAVSIQTYTASPVVVEDTETPVDTETPEPPPPTDTPGP